MTTPKEHAAPGDHPAPRKSTETMNETDERTTMTYTEEERKSEPRHETTIAGVTAWAGEWVSTPGRLARCMVKDGDGECLLVTAWIVAGDLSIDGLGPDLSPSIALVLAKVLQEAATLAQGEEVAS